LYYKKKHTGQQWTENSETLDPYPQRDFHQNLSDSGQSLTLRPPQNVTKIRS